MADLGNHIDFSEWRARASQRRAEEREATSEQRHQSYSFELVFCERCGHIDRDRTPIQPLGARLCECRRKASDARSALEAIDPFGSMTFDSLEDPHESVQSAAQKLTEIASGERSRGLFMLGPPGRGKTHLSVATLRAALDNGRLAGFSNLAELVSRIQSTYGYDDSAETKAGIIRSVAEHDLIVIDDFGKEHRSPDVESIVYQLIDAAYRGKRTLVCSTNLPVKDFRSRYDGAVLSRLNGMCEKVMVMGEDRREQAWGW
jgi:DNA replication protein DnaC